jgi:hypothetical protein
MSRKRRGASPREGRARLLDEPEPDGEEWVDWCGHLMWVAGWTEGGAPYGLTYDEWREGQLATVTKDHVRLHELVLAGKWHLEALARPSGEGPAPEESRARLRRILRMATSRTPAG